MDTRSPTCVRRTRSMRDRAGVFVAAMAIVLAGCATTHPMMPTPVLYTGAEARPLFVDLPAERQTPPLDLLFITDRVRAKGADEEAPYTAGRSRSMAFGSTTVEFGTNLSWDALLKESTEAKRDAPLELSLGPTKELGRFPPIPYDLEIGPNGISRSPAVVDEYEKAKQELQ